MFRPWVVRIWNSVNNWVFRVLNLKQHVSAPADLFIQKHEILITDLDIRDSRLKNFKSILLIDQCWSDFLRLRQNLFAHVLELLLKLVVVVWEVILNIFLNALDLTINWSKFLEQHFLLGLLLGQSDRAIDESFDLSWLLDHWFKVTQLVSLRHDLLAF